MDGVGDDPHRWAKCTGWPRVGGISSAESVIATSALCVERQKIIEHCEPGFEG